MYRDVYGKRRYSRDDIVTYIWAGLSFLFLALAMVFITVAIWTGSEQWGGTGMLMFVPTIVFGVIASIRI